MRTIARLAVSAAILLLSAGSLLAGPIISHNPAAVQAPASHGSAIASLLGTLGAGLAALGAIRVKDVGTLAKKFVRNAGAAAGDYTDGVKNAGQDWEANSRAGEDNYKAAVTQAAGEGRFGRGIAKAGAARYTQRAATLGAQRFPTGVAAAEGDWSAGAQPYLQAIAGMTLPPRRPKGDPGNMQRAQAVAQQLRAMKVGK